MTNRSTSAKVAARRGSPAPRLLDELGDWAGGAGPTYRRLARALAGAIERGTLAPGARLPSERALARQLALSRGTVLAAYDQLAGDGLIGRRHGSGTFVTDPDPGPEGPAGADRPELPADREGGPLVHHLAESSRAGADRIDLSLSVTHDADHLDLPSLTPALLRSVVPATGYTPWGLAPLREAVAAHVSGWGLPSTAEQIVITNGAQQAIAAAAACWVRPGDTVVCEDPTYPGALPAFRQAGARVVGVPVDRHGVLPGPLADALATGPALVFLQPDVHNPTGAVLAERRRRTVAELVRAARVPLVEDHAQTDTAWARPPAPIAAHVPDASVAVIGSFSKAFWGGLRVGFVRAPAPLAPRFARVKATLDLGTSVPGQLLALHLLTAGDTVVVLRRRRELLRERAEVLTGALGGRLPSWRWALPAGGLSLWVRIPGDAAAFARRARDGGVVVAAPGPLSPGDGHRDHLRLSFDLPPAILRDAVDRLAHVWMR